MEVVAHKDFTLESFRVAISRCQQVALEKAGAQIPCPEDQLVLLREGKKKTKEHKSNLCLILFEQMASSYPV